MFHGLQKICTVGKCYKTAYVPIIPFKISFKTHSYEYVILYIGIGKAEGENLKYRDSARA